MWRVVGCLLIGGWLPWSGAARGLAAEPASEFLAALRQRGYFDQALAYLDLLANNPLAPVALRETVDLEKGITLIESSRIERDLTQREKALDEAQKLIQQFINQKGGHPMVHTARSQLGSLVVERARMKTEQAKKRDRAQNLADARKLYEEGFAVFTRQRADLKAQLERFPRFLDENDEIQRQQAARRDQLRTDYLQTLLLGAAIREEMADAVPPGSKEATAYLSEAAETYDTIYKDYRVRIAGLYARMYQARCLIKLKKLKDASGFLGELLDQPDAPDAFRTLKTKVLKYAMEVWLDPSERKYVEAIRRGMDWMALARPVDDRDPEWLVLRLYLAKAYAMQAEDLQKSNPSDRQVGVSLSEAKKFATLVAKYDSDYQPEAQALLAQLGGPEKTSDQREANTFAQARDFGRETLEALETDSLLLRELPARIQAEKDAGVKANLQKQLAEAQQNRTQREQQAMRLFQRALALANDETPVHDINLVRYFLCYLYFTQGDLYQSAIIGEFVARRFPDHSAARQCAKIAMASYLKLYAENKADDKEFETNHVVEVAEYIATRWPSEPEGEEALGTLIPFMINAGQLERALEFLAKIPESSDKRTDAELKTGQAVWAAYLQGVQQMSAEEAAGTDRAAQTVKLNELKAEALRVLTAAYGRLQQRTTPDRTSLLALLALAQVYVEEQQATKAIEVLEHPQLGPLTLVAKKHSASAEPSIVEETYKTALRAYIGGLSGAADGAAMLTKAQDTMTKMKTAIASTPAGQTRMVAVFVSLARNLEDQLKVASPEAKLALSKGFESFLKQIRSETNEFSVLNWVAETFFSLGTGFETASGPSADSLRFYEESKATFDRILSETKPDPKTLTQVQIRLAAVARKQRDFKTAIDTYVKVLTENAMLVNIQVEAARTYQEWAGVPTKEALYDRAIGGHYPGADGKNILWGWGRIAQVTARHPQFRDTFHEANINMTLCRVLHAEQQQGADKERSLTSATNGLAVIRRLYPDMGGETWMRRYDAVARRLQQAKGESPIGLKAFPAPASPARDSPQTATTR
ncbi:MAG: hypothetical protein AB7F89_03745 [Pirellulaceae bacterium]